MVAAPKVQTSFLPSLPLAALQAWSTIMTGKSHKTKGTVPSENTTTVTKQKKLLPLRCISSNPKPQIHHSFSYYYSPTSHFLCGSSSSSSSILINSGGIIVAAVASVLGRPCPIP
jgi:hypothetical protein